MQVLFPLFQIPRYLFAVYLKKKNSSLALCFAFLA